ncbi:PREDICTED: mediator of RNA polymerase II transcription subunit 32-like [Ipomoea nil]|uniref:mediator of RNA polymerase II transcription subunit 32-like n=1 Tax=Ipomoea nil TaxID=35883 RepID=UPI0009011601|nr:PREDICTED: mediator of RNA polymerase II transcription subunit 32-like [Ipomoea nil]
MSLMDNMVVDPIKNAYDDLVNAATAVLEAKQSCKGQKTTAEVDAALEKFRERWDSFQCVCDGAQEFLECVRSSMGSNASLIDESGHNVAGRLEHVLSAGPAASQTGLVQTDNEQTAKD